jgi:ADP-heptose:LPS heptosyltransferase
MNILSRKFTYYIVLLKNYVRNNNKLLNFVKNNEFLYVLALKFNNYINYYDYLNFNQINIRNNFNKINNNGTLKRNFLIKLIKKHSQNTPLFKRLNLLLALISTSKNLDSIYSKFYFLYTNRIINFDYINNELSNNFKLTLTDKLFNIIIKCIYNESNFNNRKLILRLRELYKLLNQTNKENLITYLNKEKLFNLTKEKIEIIITGKFNKLYVIDNKNFIFLPSIRLISDDEFFFEENIEKQLEIELKKQNIQSDVYEIIPLSLYYGILKNTKKKKIFLPLFSSNNIDKKCYEKKKFSILIGSGLGNIIKNLLAIEYLIVCFPNSTFDIYNTLDSELSDLTIKHFFPKLNIFNISNNTTYVKKIYDLKIIFSSCGESLSHKIINSKFELNYRKLYTFYDITFNIPEEEYNLLILNEFEYTRDDILKNSSNFNLKQTFKNTKFENKNKKRLNIGINYNDHKSLSNFKKDKNYPHKDKLIKKLSLKHNIFLFGSPIKNKSIKGSNLANIIDLRNIENNQIINELQKLDLFIGEDEGMVHLSAILNINTIILFGPTNILKNNLQRKNVFPITSNVKCSPCHLENETNSCNFRMCMFNIKIENIVSKINKSLNTNTNLNRRNHNIFDIDDEFDKQLSRYFLYNDVLNETDRVEINKIIENFDISTFNLISRIYFEINNRKKINLNKNQLHKISIHVSNFSNKRIIQFINKIDNTKIKEELLVNIFKNLITIKQKKKIYNLIEFLNKQSNYILNSESLKKIILKNYFDNGFRLNNFTDKDYQKTINFFFKKGLLKLKHEKIYISPNDLNNVNGGEISSLKIFSKISKNLTFISRLKNYSDHRIDIVKKSNKLFINMNQKNILIFMHYITNNFNIKTILGHGYLFNIILNSINKKKTKLIFYQRHFKDVFGEGNGPFYYEDNILNIKDFKKEHEFLTFNKNKLDLIVFNSFSSFKITNYIYSQHGLKINNKQKYIYVPLDVFKNDKKKFKVKKSYKIGILNIDFSLDIDLILYLSKNFPHNKFYIFSNNKFFSNNKNIIFIKKSYVRYDLLFKKFDICLKLGNLSNILYSGPSRILLESILTFTPIITNKSDSNENLIPENWTFNQSIVTNNLRFANLKQTLNYFHDCKFENEIIKSLDSNFMKLIDRKIDKSLKQHTNLISKLN